MKILIGYPQFTKSTKKNGIQKEKSRGKNKVCVCLNNN